jgi:hypothetical protein
VAEFAGGCCVVLLLVPAAPAIAAPPMASAATAAIAAATPLILFVILLFLSWSDVDLGGKVGTTGEMTVKTLEKFLKAESDRGSDAGQQNRRSSLSGRVLSSSRPRNLLRPGQPDQVRMSQVASGAKNFEQSLRIDEAHPLDGKC